MKSVSKLVISAFLITALMLPTVIYAGLGNLKDLPEQAEGKVRARIIEGYMKFDAQRIRIEGRTFDSDEDPVIKSGRTLIPVRALTRGFGCDVLWNSDDKIAYVVSPDAMTVWAFDLVEGEAIRYEFEDPIYDPMDGPPDVDDLEDDLDDADEVTVLDIDVPPGLIGNRTFVPLRFIAKELKLGVNYNHKTKDIKIDRMPSLNPDEVEIEVTADSAMTTDTAITVNPRSFEFIDITEEDTGDPLEEGEDYEVDESTTDSTLTVTLMKDYLDDLDMEDTTLLFNFDDEVSKEFEIMFITEEPSIDPDELEIEVTSDSAMTTDSVIMVYPRSFEFIDITEKDSGDPLDEGYNDDYQVDESTTDGALIVTLSKDYLDDLDMEDTTLLFNFEDDISIEFDIIFEREEPSIDPDKLEIEVTTDSVLTTDTAITVYPRGYEFISITEEESGDPLEEGYNDDYQVDDSTTDGSLIVTLSKEYLDNLDEEDTTLLFNFEDGISEEFEIEFVEEDED